MPICWKCARLPPVLQFCRYVYADTTNVSQVSAPGALVNVELVTFISRPLGGRLKRLEVRLTYRFKQQS